MKRKPSGHNHKGRLSAVASERRLENRGRRRNKGNREEQTKWGQKREGGRGQGGERKDFQLRRVYVIRGPWHAGEVTQTPYLL